MMRRSDVCAVSLMLEVSAFDTSKQDVYSAKQDPLRCEVVENFHKFIPKRH